MAKLVSQIRTSWFVKFSLVFVSMRGWSLLGRGPLTFPDTQTYTVLDFSGVHTSRGWTLPLLYWIVRPNTLRMAVQFLFATTAWITVAYTFKSRIQNLRVQQFAVVGCFIVGVSATVVGWDRALLSESLSISLGVFTICAWLAFARRPDAKRLAILALCTFPFAFIRQGSIPALGLVGLVALLHGLRYRKFRTWVVAAVITLSATSWAVYFSSQNDGILLYNRSQILATRIFPNEQYLAWFEREGLPVSPQLKANAAKWNQSAEAQFAVQGDPGLIAWPLPSFTKAYKKFVLTHPKYALFHWYENRDDFAASVPGVSVTTVLPSAIDSTFVAGGGATSVLVLSAISATLVLFFRPKRQRGDPHLRRFGFAMVALFIPWSIAIWLTVTLDLSRIGVTTAVCLHLGVLALVCAALDGAFETSETADEAPAA